MAEPLGTHDAQVHATARSVLDFWFGLTREQHFAKDDALDHEIATRFGTLRDDLLAAEAAGWRDHSDTLLAAVIVLDQFSRNIHRGTAQAFAADDLAIALTLQAISIVWDTAMTVDKRAFLYLPLEHAEDTRLQALSVEKFTALGDADYLGFAKAHAAVIDRFGRFPSRNAALRRTSTPAEEDWLAAGGGW